MQPIQIERNDQDTYVIATGAHKGAEIGRITFTSGVYSVHPSMHLRRILPGNVVSYQHTDLDGCNLELMSLAYKLAADLHYT